MKKMQNLVKYRSSHPVLLTPLFSFTVAMTTM